MAPVGQGETTFEVASDVDITKLPLTSEEGFVVSRVLGRRFTVADLAREGIAPGKAKTLIDSLVRKGALLIMTRGRSMEGAAVNDPYAGVIFSAADMHEPVDLTEEQ